MKKKETPLMRQYHQIKKKHPDTILLFRLGDFFETFEDDAEITARVCGITLTKRNNGTAGQIPLAGFPHHQLDNYLPKLVRSGYRVSVCEQIEDPKKARGIVRRDVVEVVTPGVAFNEKLLDTKHNNYIVGLTLFKIRQGAPVVGIACADISTGEFFTTEASLAEIRDILESLQPTEALFSKQQAGEFEGIVSSISSAPTTTKLEEWIFNEEFGRDTLLEHFATTTLKGFGVEHLTAGIAAAGAVLHYFGETQKGRLGHIRRIALFNPSEYMALDFATKRNLEITFSIADATRSGTLISILDKTQTAMGGRMFKRWITRPLCKLEMVQKRQNAVESLVKNVESRAQLRNMLAEVGDIERLMAKVCTGRATPRDIVSLKNTFKKIPLIQSIIANSSSHTLQGLGTALEPMADVVQMLEEAIVEEPPAQVGGAVFREHFSPELDEIREAMYSGKTWIADFQEQQRTETGISSLKVGFNNVFGYYLEITHTHRDRVPERYERKQTLTNAERYTTPELKEIEAKVLNAEERIGELERELFNELRQKVAEQADTAQNNAQALAIIDCLQSFAEAACEYDYCLPIINNDAKIAIRGGRHPVVERLLPVGEPFVSNSTLLDVENSQIHVITGPNMSGKSCYLRQVALITLLAQIGSYVPAEDATIGIVDRIFTRVGAQDNITAGESTFLVEMQEAANILNNATAQSLILLDEVGRGTSTFDGISIAWSMAEYLHNAVRARTLFATHYHELNELAARFERIRNFKVDVREIGDKILFTHTVVEGAADHSFGIHVAEMAGLPRELLARAREIMITLETQSSADPKSGDGVAARAAETQAIAQTDNSLDQLALFEIRDDKIRDRIKRIDVNRLTPIEALHELEQLKKAAHDE